jgi:CheY-like chemotaxis protein
MSRSPDNGQSQEATKLRVLVVDDEPTLRLGFAYALSNHLTTVETAASGRQALERIAATNYDVMILDLRMPDLDGLGVIETLRNQGNNLATVLCSAALSPNASLRAIRLGVVDFLLKPVRPTDLRQVIEFVLQPGTQPLPRALQEARRGHPGEAIRILSGEAVLGGRAACWLSALKSIHDAEATAGILKRGDEAIEEKLRPNLATLAFNTALVP